MNHSAEKGTRTLGSVGQYALLSRLGEGGMGTVYKARHTRLDKVVALKVLLPNRIRDERAIDRFHREMAAVGRLEHPHIVRATDAGEHDGIFFLVMEYVDGVDLQDLLNAHGQLPVADACEIVRQAASGLEYVRRNGLVHRDIKPSNLMLTRTGVVKILDLGLARLACEHRAAGTMTDTDHVLGTVDYMAPEQCADSHAVDIRADIYSLGCTFYALLAGAPPFSGSRFHTPFEKMKAHVQEPVVPLNELEQTVPQGVVELSGRMLEKSPDDRPRTPAEVARAAAPFAVGHDLPADVDQVPSIEVTVDTSPGRAAAATDADSTSVRKKHGWIRRWMWIAAAILWSLSAIAAFVAFFRGNDIPEQKPAVTPVAFEQVPGFVVSITERAELRGHRNEIWSVAFAPDGAVLASAGVDQVIKIWNPAAGHEIDEITGLTDEVRCIAFSPVERTLAAGGADPVIRMWDLTSGKEHSSLFGHTSEVRGLDFAPDGQMLASVGYDHSLRFWDPTASECLRDVRAHDTRVQCVAFVGNETVATAGDDGTIKFWNARDGSLKNTIENSTDGVTSIAFADGGRLLASSHWDGSILLRDMQFTREPDRLQRHRGAVRAVAFSPDGRTLASAGRDQYIMLWDVQTGRVIEVLDGHDGEVTSVAFSPQGDLLASAGSDEIVRIWDVHIDRSGHAELERVAAERILSRDGKLSVRTYDGKTRAIETASDLPENGYHVVGIELPANLDITEADAKMLEPLVAVESLRLAGTALTDQTLSRLAGMERLHYANLSSTRISGRGFKAFSSLEDFKTFRASETPFNDTGIAHLTKAHRLETLSLDSTQVTDKGLRLFNAFPELRVLDLDLSRVTDAGLAHLSGLKHLESIQLYETRVGDAGLSSLSRIPTLQQIRLGNTEITDTGLKSLQRLNTLQDIDLANTHVTNTGVSSLLASMSTIHEVILDDTSVTLAGLQPLQNHPELQRFSTNNSRITDEVFDLLEEASDLYMLRLAGTAVTDAGLQRLSGCTKLRSLYIASTNVTGRAFSDPELFPGLTELFFAWSKADDEALAHLATRSQLSALDVGYSQVTDSGLRHLEDSSNLQYLHLSGNEITDAGLEHLVELKNLLNLQLLETQVTEKGIETLRKAIPGCNIEY
ncbi:MAG: protein kinase domain-containing protein [Planctomycetota bacterium]